MIFTDSTRDRKNLILIADDSEMNRSILGDMLGEEYEIIEAADGAQALELIEKNDEELSLILLDIVMPEIDGFGVLEKMNETNIISRIPVIMISAESKASSVERAFELGVTDFISRPFDSLIVHRRVVNTLFLYSKQKKLMDIAAKQIYEKEKQSILMIEILSHIVEFRNGESGRHVRRVRIFTEILLNELVKRSDYKFTRAEIFTISTASALHDIGKIAIPEHILNKPAALTPEEFEVIKTHSLIGAKMLTDLPINDDSDLVDTAYAICRWHHERYDGSGYPDALKGDEIPIFTQVVALADVYDALTSDRVYKKAVSHKAAVKMIANGECGAFNPVLIECLLAIEEELFSQLADRAPLSEDSHEARHIIEEMLQRDEVTASKRTLTLMENERMKLDSFASLTKEIQFEYKIASSTIVFLHSNSDVVDLPESLENPLTNSTLLSVMKVEDMKLFSEKLQGATPDNSEFSLDCRLNINGEQRWFRILNRALWSSSEPPVCSGVIGKAIDIHDSHMLLTDLERKASTDGLTGILNHAGAKKIIKSRLKDGKGKKFALAIFDLDNFKQANDTYGHMFGDEVLVHTAKCLSKSIRNSDVTARVGGDEFLIFLEYKSDLEHIIKRIFSALTTTYEDFKISLSMGVATTDTIGYDYDSLFGAADKALYSTKRRLSGNYCFYDGSI